MKKYKPLYEKKVIKVNKDTDILDIFFSVSVNFNQIQSCLESARLNLKRLVDIKNKTGFYEADEKTEHKNLIKNIENTFLYLEKLRKNLTTLLPKLDKEMKNKELDKDTLNEYQEEFDNLIDNFNYLLGLFESILKNEDNLKIIIQDSGIKEDMSNSIAAYNRIKESIINFAKIFQQRKGVSLKNYSKLEKSKPIEINEFMKKI